MGNADAHSRRGNKNDFYITPFPCVRALIEKASLPDSFSYLDPCSGSGVIGKVFSEYGIKIDTSEITEGTDFFDITKKYDCIVCNPPYSKKDLFLEHAFSIAEHVFFILPYNVGNYNCFHSDSMARPEFIGKYLMTPKFFMTEEETENPKRGGISAYAWYYWRPKTKRKEIESFERYINLNDYFKAS